MSYPKEFCHQYKHCRRDGHQSTFRDSKKFQQRVDNNERDMFTTYDQCTKCDPYKNRPAQWLHGTTSSQVMIPPNYFQPMYVDRDSVPFERFQHYPYHPAYPFSYNPMYNGPFQPYSVPPPRLQSPSKDQQQCPPGNENSSSR